ncbi:MAG: arylsulfatase [Oscillospiraceae bacterium]
MSRPNIVLLMTDQMRGDCLGIAGHPDVKTPYLDTLATRGVLFDRAYSACPSCIPARAALHTGMSQEHHGRVGYEDGVPFRYENTLAGELKKAGYYTQCVGKMHVHPLRNLMGFDHIELHDGALGYYRRPDIPYYESQKVADDYFYWLKNEKGVSYDVADTGIQCNSWVSRPWPYEEELHPTNWVAQRSIDFLRRRDRDKPFFLFASFVRPHPPFDAPQCYFDLYRDMPIHQPPIGDWADTERCKREGRIVDSLYGIADEEMVRQAQIGYYACITHVDHQIGRIINALTDEGIMDNTIFLFCSDHGEMLGDHHTYRKARAQEGSAHIPFFISGPERLIGRHGVCHEVAELRDVMPTILDYVGAPIPDSVDGAPLRPVIEDGAPLREYLHGEHSLGEVSNQFIVTKTDKYIWETQTGREFYFRLDTDPQETHNAIGDAQYRERIAYLRGLLIQALDGREEGYTDGVRLIPGKPPVDGLEHLYRSVGRK